MNSVMRSMFSILGLDEDFICFPLTLKWKKNQFFGVPFFIWDVELKFYLPVQLEVKIQWRNWKEKGISPGVMANNCPIRIGHSLHGCFWDIIIIVMIMCVSWLADSPPLYSILWIALRHPPAVKGLISNARILIIVKCIHLKTGS